MLCLFCSCPSSKGLSILGWLLDIHGMRLKHEDTSRGSCNVAVGLCRVPHTELHCADTLALVGPEVSWWDVLTAPPPQSGCRHQDPPALARKKSPRLDLHRKGIYVLKYLLNKMLLLFHPKLDSKLNWCLLYIKGANSGKKCILYFSSEGGAVDDNSRRLLEKEVITYTTQILTQPQLRETLRCGIALLF